MRRLRIACIQVSASANLPKNLQRIQTLTQRALKKKPQLIAFPENFCWRGSAESLPVIADAAGAILDLFCEIARKHKTYLLLGSLIERASKPGKYFNTSFLISPEGRVCAKYRKIHLFSIGLANVKTNEAAHIHRGAQPVAAKIQGVKMGLSICYDLRFPELYRKLTSLGAKVLLVPSNFTYVTGKAHWEVLLKARAIENQAFVIAPAQSGVSPSNKIKSFGTSLVIDPWGKVLARGPKAGESVLFADLDLRAQAELRTRFPVLRHRVLKEVF